MPAGPRCNNAILVPTWYSGTHQTFRDAYIGVDHALDPAKYFIVWGQPDRQRPVDLTAQRRRAQL